MSATLGSQIESISSYPAKLFTQCEVLLAYLANRTASQSAPVPILELLANQSASLHAHKNVEQCVHELSRLLADSHRSNSTSKAPQPLYAIQERSSSLLIFVYLIVVVSFISVAGNLCLAKVLYTKRLRLTQTDRIVLCLAISELCLVLIDSPTEIYRFMSYSFSVTWLCRFHTFLESFFSSCIIFYHLLGAVDRFVYIHGHVSSRTSAWSIWCRRMTAKSSSIVLLILPVMLSLPIAVCNLLHAQVIATLFTMKICVVQYNHRLLISILLTFYILPLFLSFFLHARLIYFIRSRHIQRYLTATNNQLLSIHRTHNNADSQAPAQRRQRLITRSKPLSNGQLHLPKSSKKKTVMFTTETMRNTGPTFMTTTTGGPLGGLHNSSNSSASSRSSTGTGFSSINSPMILYKINLQADANAKRTVLLLVLLLSFYILCWAPYNVYTWRYAYQLTRTNQTAHFFNRAMSMDVNLTSAPLVDNIHGNLRRFIFINYSLYLLSLLSMCFSFVFYFSLNKHARQEFSYLIGCICPRSCEIRANEPKQHELYAKARRVQYDTRYQYHHAPGQRNAFVAHENRRERTMRFNTHPVIVPPVSPQADGHHHNGRSSSLKPKQEILASKRPVPTYGCHVQCCP